MKTGFVRFLVALLFAGAFLGAVAPMVAGADGDVVECRRLVEANLETQAFPHCQIAAEAGDATSQYYLGRMYGYTFGGPVSHDQSMAIKWFRLAADQGNAHAQYSLGLAYHSGSGVSQDHGIAMKWFRLAAVQGVAWAGLHLAQIYRNGEGVKVDHYEAIKWFRFAAERGLSFAQYNLGLAYYEGRGTRQDKQEAAKWFALAAEQGHGYAQVKLVNMYREGDGVVKSNVIVAKWLSRLAEEGDASAQYNLGLMYDHGNGVTKSRRDALKWWRRAADQGIGQAQTNLGNAYFDGTGVEQNYGEALKWFSLAAAQGHAQGQNNLAAMYTEGKGVITDPREAFIWYSIAAANGSKYATNNMRNIENQLSHSEIRSARAEARKRMVAIEAGTYGKKAASPPPSVATAPSDGGATPAQTAFENVWRSVVFIQTSERQGSGVIVRPHIVATNCHVIEDAGSISVYKAVDKRADKSTSYAATSRRYDFDRDVCLLNVAGLFGVSAQFRNADSLSIGENVYAVGAPKGLDLSLSGGFVSQLRRDGYGAPIIQTDAAISPGSSGGALVDGSGYVVGITTSKRVGKNVEGIAFAVPIEWVLEMME